MRRKTGKREDNQGRNRWRKSDQVKHQKKNGRLRDEARWGNKEGAESSKGMNEE